MSNFIFNNITLDEGYYRVKNINFDNLWTLDVPTFNYPMVDWWWVLWQYYREKQITIDMAITATTASLLATAVDALKAWVSWVNWNLDIVVDWVTRRCLATCVWLDFWRQPYNITFLQSVRLTFVTLAPHWKATAVTTITDNIGLSTWITFVNSWTVWVYPKFSFTFWATGNILYILYRVWTNDVTINCTPVIWDVLIVDTEKKIVTLNWTAVDYSWVFPKLLPWTTSLSFFFINAWAWFANWTIETAYFKTYY